MDKPLCPDVQPHITRIEPGEYWWCGCGRSARQPFCDGAHKEIVDGMRITEIKPVSFTIDEPKNVALCMCKQSRNPPFCDGSHKSLNDQNT